MKPPKEEKQKEKKPLGGRYGKVQWRQLLTAVTIIVLAKQL